jgi:hypothetical protein
MTFQLNVVSLVEEGHWFEFEHHGLVRMVVSLDFHHHHHHHHPDQERMNRLFELLNLVELIIPED